MKRIVLAVAALAMLLGAGFVGSAQAHGPQRPPGFRGHGHQHGHYCNHCCCYHAAGQCGSRAYSNRPIYGGFYSGHVPYGAGYSGGWQPYRGGHYRQPGFGLYIGF